MGNIPDGPQNGGYPGQVPANQPPPGYGGCQPMPQAPPPGYPGYPPPQYPPQYPGYPPAYPQYPPPGFAQNPAQMQWAHALRSWTGKTNISIVYDSTVNPFTAPELFQKIKDKPDIAIIALTSDGDVFGGYHSVAVSSQNWPNHDEKLFVFSFVSHGRCSTPQKFEVKAYKKSFGSVRYRDHDFDGHFVEFTAGAAGGLSLGNEKSKTFCDDLDDCFENIQKDTLTGKRNRETFTCTRLVALQLY